MSFDKSLLKLAYSLSYKYADKYYSADELIGESHLAICDILKNFDPSNGAKITTYAHTVISRRIFKYKNKNQKHYINRQSIYINHSTVDSSHIDIACSRSTRYMENYISHDFVEKIKAYLTEEEFQIIDLRYGLTSSPKTIIEVANLLGMNRESLRRKQKKIEHKIHLKFSRSDLENTFRKPHENFYPQVMKKMKYCHIII